jgi:hypothetical protein
MEQAQLLHKTQGSGAEEIIHHLAIMESLDKRGLSSGSEQKRVPLTVNCL